MFGIHRGGNGLKGPLWPLFAVLAVSRRPADGGRSMSDWTDDRAENDTDAVATKPELWRPIAERVGGFDLDVAAGCEPTPIAENRYTPADDGLSPSSRWYGWIWMNPPFGDPEPWFRRLKTEVRGGDVDGAVAVARDAAAADYGTVGGSGELVVVIG